MNILLTGANGYLGRRLLPSLVNEGHNVYCLVRDERRFSVPDEIKSRVTIITGDLLSRVTLDNVPENIDAAYYLVHSMASSKSFERDEETSAGNFKEALEKTSAKQIIYLGGISNADNLSKHLSSRLNVENILKSSKIPVTVLRAAIIIGSGSASFEIIRDLVEKLPVMIAPKWVNVRCQSIGVRDVVRYLCGVLLNEDAYNMTFDIGGKDILTYKEMMLMFARIRGLKRYLIGVPVLSPRLSSYWLYFVTSTSYDLAKNLVSSLKNEVVCGNDSIKNIVPGESLSYEEAVKIAFEKIEHEEVLSSWTDSIVSGKISRDYINKFNVPVFGCFKDKKIIEFSNPIEKVKNNLWEIGGNRGWYYMNWAWKIRGFLDKVFGGVGLRRGRRHPTVLNPGDALDFWRVLLSDRECGRLMLYAEMKLPGEAWLEFNITKKQNKNYLTQEATFRPKGLLGRLYWYILYPLHIFIFKNMAKGIINFDKEF